ncbi:MAG TPA: pilin [bacterium]|nr:pilin [bacterium]
MFYNKSKAYKLFFVFVVLFFLTLFFVNLSSVVFASDDLGMGVVDKEIVLKNSDPRSIASKIINIALGFLGIIAVIIVIYGGFIWMTAGGEEDKIDKAKKTLKAGVIGLAIILASWGIVAFVFNKLGDATGNGSGGSCNSGETQDCGCGGTKSCLSSDSWGNCIGSTCDPGSYGSACSSGLAGTCIKDNTKCNSGLICGDSCTCINEGEGDSCGVKENESCSPNNDDCNNNLTCDPDSCTCEVNNGNEFNEPCGDTKDGVCSPDNNDCNLSHGLTCDPNSCTCVGAPIITKISPMGGFCDNDVNKSCTKDADCSGGTCNLNTPNATAGNLITILGYNFGDSVSSSRVNFIKGNTVVEGQSPADFNSNCDNFWSNTKIIIALPTSTSSNTSPDL